MRNATGREGEKLGRTLYDKLWDCHVVAELREGESLIYIDRHLVHEVTSPQAFESLRAAGRHVARPDLTLAVADHNIPTDADFDGRISDPLASTQVEVLKTNCAQFGIPMIAVDDLRRGIVHVIGPELGFTLPGLSVVCGDSHTATHGAIGALAFGIGTSEIEHVLATQTLVASRSRTMLVRIDGTLGIGVSAKDLALYVIRTIGTAGGTGFAIEFAGRAIEELSIESRLTLCNMAIEAGARSGLVAVDEKTIAYVSDRVDASQEEKERMSAHWRTLISDPQATFDRVLDLDAGLVAPTVTWGTSPEHAEPIDGTIPDPVNAPDSVTAEAWKNALDYMGLTAGMLLEDVQVDRIFIGSCTNGRIEDIRAAAEVARGRRVADGVRAMVVPGSGSVRAAAEAEGLDEIFKAAGFEWRQPGCSMCLAMNADRLSPGERCASTSNRNFEGRQGFRGRTHLMSPAMAAAAAVTGRLADVRRLPRI